MFAPRTFSRHAMFLWLIGLFLVVLNLPAQVTTATILGTVTDPTGASVPRAKVTVTNDLTGFTRSSETASDGTYLISLIPIGESYRLTVDASGFRSFSRVGIGLQMNQNARVDAALQVGTTSETVEVSGGAPLVDTYSSAGGDVVERKRIVELPLNGRNPLQLATLVAGVTVSNNPTALTGGNRGGNYVSVNGSRLNETNYQLDGMSFQGAYFGAGLNYPSPDALEEFKLVTSSYSAEYGYFAGAIFTAAVKSGTNQLHGSGWEFLRNDKLNARNFFAPQVPILRQNQFGASAGFPVLKNKLFGFASYQGLRIRGVSIASSFPLTANERQGIFAGRIVDPRTGQPFPNNTIPRDRFNPVSAKLLNDFIPVAPDTGGGLLVTTGANPTNVNQWVGRTDYRISDKDSVNSSYLFDKTTFKTPFGSGPYPAYGARDEDQVIGVWSATHTHIFSPGLINQFRGGLSKQEEVRGCSQKLSPRDLGINIDLEGPPQPPNVAVTGRFSIGGSGICDWIEGGTNWQIGNSLNWIKGRHNFKFGADLIRREWHLQTAFMDPGAFNFDGSATGNAAADFLLGSLTSVSRRPRVNAGGKSWNHSYFAQDDFKVSSRLTLNLGLRWEFHGPFSEYLGESQPNYKMPKNATFRLGQQSKVLPTAPVGLLFTGDKTPDFPDGLPPSMVKLDRKQIQPRVGFAWDVFGNGRTSVRGSYGLYSNAHFGDLSAQSVQNQPFLLGQSLFQPAGGFSDPWRGIPNPFPRVVDVTKPESVIFVIPGEAFGWDANFSSPRIQALALSVQREVFKNLSFDLGYVGKLSRHLYDTRNINQAVYVPGFDANGLPLSTLGNVDARRRRVPNIYQKINILFSDQNASYHSLQFTAKYRTNHATIQSAYTFSKSIDTGQNYSLQGVVHQDNENPLGDRSLAEFDRRHVWRLSWVYDTPTLKSGNKAMNLIVNGWQISGITSVVSGAPYSIVTGRDNSLTGQGNDRPDLVGNPSLSGGRSRAEQIVAYFNKAAFTPNKTGQFGNVGRNTMIGPPLVQTDLGLFRNFGITERFRLQFRAELFNAFNQVNFNNPVNSATSTVFGRLSSSKDPRLVQMGLKLNY